MSSDAQRAAARDVLANAKAKTSRVRIVLDGDLLDEHALLEHQLAAADRDSDEAVAVAEQLVALEERLAAAEVEFVFKGMGRGRWRKMEADHPPSDEQRARGATFDSDELPFIAMAATLVSPQLTVDDLKQLNEDVLDEAEFLMLWGSCLDANLGSAANRPESEAARSVLQSVRLRSAQASDSGSAAAS